MAALWGPNGTQEGNLNKDSTHPNPWRPPSERERYMAMGHFASYRILNDPRNAAGPIKKGHNFIEEDPFLTNVRWGAFAGFKIGAIVAANDIVNVHSIMGTRARVARCCYIIPPYVAAGTSWILAREFLGNFGQEKNGLWSYPVAVAAPATIWGIFKNSIESGLRFFVFGGLAAAAYKFNKDKGHVFQPEDSFFAGGKEFIKDHDHLHDRHRISHADVDGWQGWPFKIDSVKTWWTPVDEPTWKKHVSPEEANKGPPTNF